MANIGGLIIGWIYYALMESSKHQATVGKIVIGLKVVDAKTLQRVTFAQATGRFFARIVSAVPLTVGFLIQPFTKQRQTLHDMMAGCLVLKRDGGPVSQQTAPPPTNAPPQSHTHVPPPPAPPASTPPASTNIANSPPPTPRPTPVSSAPATASLASSPPPVRKSEPVPVVQTTSICAACGAANPDGVNFCEHCGAALTYTCPECGQEGDTRKPFCGKCGTNNREFQRIKSAIARIGELRQAYDYDQLKAELDALAIMAFAPRCSKGEALLEEAEKVRSNALDLIRGKSSDDIETALKQTPPDTARLTAALKQYEQRVGPLPSEYIAAQSRLPALGYLENVAAWLNDAEQLIGVGNLLEAESALGRITTSPTCIDAADTAATQLFYSENESRIRKVRSRVEAEHLATKAVESFLQRQHEECIDLCNQIAAKAGDIRIIRGNQYDGSCFKLRTSAEFERDAAELDEAIRSQRWSRLKVLANKLLEQYPNNDRSARSLEMLRSHRNSKIVLLVGMILILFGFFIAHVSNKEAKAALAASLEAAKADLAALQAAAARGDAAAQFQLGSKYHQGSGVPQDNVQASCWFRQAAELGHTEAQYRIGLVYKYGIGFVQDRTEAVKWLTLASMSGHKGARDALTNFFSVEQIAEGRRRADAFVPAK